MTISQLIDRTSLSKKVVITYLIIASKIVWNRLTE